MSDSNKKITRRRLLQAGGVSAAAVATNASLAAPVKNSQSINWDHEVDVVVCGSGAAGSMAALTARKAGASVALLEKSAAWGGTSGKAGFHIWIPNNKAMLAEGYEDNKEDCLLYMAQQSYPHLFHADSPTLGLSERLYKMLETYYDNAAYTVGLLSEWKVAEFVVARLGYDQIAAIDYNENSPYNKAIVGRSMAPLDLNGESSHGRFVTDQFRKRLREAEVDIRMQHRASKLHRNSKNQVIGVQAVTAAGETVNIRARRGVIFGSGCYTANKEYMSHYQMMPTMGGCGASSNEGDFIGIAGEAGAQMGNLSGAWRAQVLLEDAISLVSTPTAVFWPIGDAMFIVNRYGKRCINEKRNYNDRTKELYHYDANLCEFPNLINFMVFDQRVADLYRGFYPIPLSAEHSPHVARGNTLAELADDIRARLAKHAAHTGGLTLDEAFDKNFAETFAHFNRMAKKGVDKDFRRGEFEYDKAWHDMTRPMPNPKWPEKVNPDNTTMHPLQGKGPYYAVILLPGCIGTNGGPVIDADSQVLDYQNQPIDGLYGAGNCIAAPAANAYWGGGTTIGSALIFGRIAGENAAKSAIKGEA